MLARTSPSRLRRFAGAGVAAIAASAFGLAAWALQPEQPQEAEAIVVPLNTPEDVAAAHAEILARGGTVTPMGDEGYSIEMPQGGDQEAAATSSAVIRVNMNRSDLERAMQAAEQARRLSTNSATGDAQAELDRARQALATAELAAQRAGD